MMTDSDEHVATLQFRLAAAHSIQANGKVA